MPVAQYLHFDVPRPLNKFFYKYIRAAKSVERLVAGLLKSHIRESDMACRYGGEEFMLILPDATPDGARQRAESIRILISGLDLKYNDQPLGTITASLGVALFPQHAENAESLIHASDEALYEAKAAGRDRVIISKTK